MHQNLTLSLSAGRGEMGIKALEKLHVTSSLGQEEKLNLFMLLEAIGEIKYSRVRKDGYEVEMFACSVGARWLLRKHQG